MALSKTVRDAWEANLRVNEVLLKHLTPEMLTAETPGEGFNVAQHLAHIVWVVKLWGGELEVSMERLPDLFTSDPVTTDFVAETDLERIRTVLAETAEAAREAVDSRANGDKGALPHPSAEAYLVHMMVHDAHHRGQVLLALKAVGHPLPDEDLMWGPWRGE